MTAPIAADDKVGIFIEAVQHLLPTKLDYLTQSTRDGLIDALTTANKGNPDFNTTVLKNLNTQNIKGAARAFVDQTKKIAEEAHKAGGVLDVSDTVASGILGLGLRAQHKDFATHKVDKHLKEAFKLTVGKTSDIAQSMEKSYDQFSRTVGGQAVRYGTAAVGTFLIYNRLKAMFKTKEVQNEQTGEIERKSPSFLSRVGNLALAVGLGVLTYKVGYENKTFGQVGEDLGNTWAKYVTNRKNAPTLPFLKP